MLRSLCELPELQFEAGKLALCPVTERCIEAKHADVMKNIKLKRYSPSGVSMAVRLRGIQQHLQRDPMYYEKLCSQIELCKHVRRLPMLLDLQAHPWVRGLPVNCSQHYIVSVLSKVIYRCDLLSQFQSYDAARAQHEHIKKKRSPPLLTGSFNSPIKEERDLLLYWATHHFRELCSGSHVYSLPLSRDIGLLPGGTSLEKRLSRRAVHRAEAPSNSNTDMELDAEVEAWWQPPLGGQGRMSEHTGPSIRVYFRFVHVTPSRQKLVDMPATSGQKLRADEMVMQVLAAQQEGRSAVPLQNTSRHSLAVMSYLDSDPVWLRQNLQVHHLEGRLSYTLKGRLQRPSGSSVTVPTDNAAALDEAGALLQRLMSAGACSGSYVGCKILASDPMYDHALALCNAGVLQHVPAAGPSGSSHTHETCSHP